MRSKQINFFITPDDMQEIDIFLKKENCIIVLNNVSDPDMAFGFDIVKNKEQLFQVYLTKEEFKKHISFKYISSQDYYYVYDTKSDVIEFSIGGFYPYSNKELHRGRFYYVFEYYNDDGDTTQKSIEFIQWADDIVKKFKKHFLKKAPELTSDFFSDKALSWAKSNHAKPIEGGLKLAVS